MHPVKLIDAGQAGYKQIWDLQLNLFNEAIRTKQAGGQPMQHLILVEHPHVYTFGKHAKREHLLAGPEELESMGAEVYDIERGGDITYHGPGQLVAYPIFDLEQLGIGVKAFVEGIEKAIMGTLQHWQIDSGIIPDRIGVWLDIGGSNERKIAAIGIKCSRYVSMHGLALNVNTDLNMFGHIVPCGIADKAVASMEQELGRQIDMSVVKNELGRQFAHIFGLKLEK